VGDRGHGGGWDLRAGVASRVGSLGPKDHVITTLSPSHGRREEPTAKERQEHSCHQRNQAPVSQHFHRVCNHRAAMGDTLARWKGCSHDLKAL
jgi:hypothetical protein